MRARLGSQITRAGFAGPARAAAGSGHGVFRVNWRDPGQWFAQHHLTYWIAYQPHSRLVWFQLARNGIMVVAVCCVLAAVWWLRKHPAGKEPPPVDAPPAVSLPVAVVRRHARQRDDTRLLRSADGQG